MTFYRAAQFEPTKQDGKVTRVCDGGEEQGAETLVQLEGKVRGTGDQGGEQGQVWVAEKKQHFKLSSEIREARYL